MAQAITQAPVMATPSPATARRVVASDAELLVDGGVIVAGSVAICVASHRLLLMTVLIPALMVLRTVLWWRVTRARRAPLLPEVAYLALCTALGGGNDWNSVVNHRIYDYTVPHYAPGFSTIPIWMLLFWGLILRLFTTLTSYHRLGAGSAQRNGVGVGPWTTQRAWLRVALLLVLVFATRQTVYRFYLDPLWSWIPFAAAAVLYGVCFVPDRHELRIAGLTLVVGPLVEVLYIQVAGLHRYHLGWIGGVPLWIALWWVVAVLVWKDLGSRLQSGLIRVLAPHPR